MLGSPRAGNTVTHAQRVAMAPPTPSTVPLPTGPYAVTVTNNNRSGNTYDVLLINTSGRIVARTTARLL